MTGEQFVKWLAEMKTLGLANTDKAAAELLGVTTTTMLNLKAKGTNRRTALACAALVKEIPPFEG